MRMHVAIPVAISLLLLARYAQVGLMHYPKEVQRSAQGQHIVIVEARPTDFILQPELLFGSLHNNTSIDVSLYMGETRIARETLIKGGDLPDDHLPVEIIWTDENVAIREPHESNVIRFQLPGNDS